MANRKREIELRFRVSPEEQAMIQKKMEQLDTTNMAAYLRKMAIDGYVVNLELPGLQELVSLLRRYGANLNQLTKRIHATGHAYDADLEEIHAHYDKLWDGISAIMTSLAKLQ